MEIIGQIFAYAGAAMLGTGLAFGIFYGVKHLLRKNRLTFFKRKVKLRMTKEEAVLTWLSVVSASKFFVAVSGEQRAKLNDISARMLKEFDCKPGEKLLNAMQLEGTSAGLSNTMNAGALINLYETDMGACTCSQCNAPLIAKVSFVNKYVVIGCSKACNEYSNILIVANVDLDEQSGIFKGIAKQYITDSKERPLRISAVARQAPAQTKGDDDATDTEG